MKNKEAVHVYVAGTDVPYATFYNGSNISESFDKLLQEMSETYRKKNADYGNSFDQSLDEFGMTAALVRMNDKMNRLKTLSKQEAKVDESMRDTLMDLANYAVMTVQWLEQR